MTLEIPHSDYYRFAQKFSVEDQAMLAQLRTFLNDRVAPRVNDLWAKEEFPYDLVQPLADMGLFGLPFKDSKHYHGDAFFRGWVSFEIAKVDASLATFLGVQAELSTGSIALCGSSVQVREWIPRLTDGSTIASCGITEPGSGSDTARGMQTTAKREGDSWVLNGQKRWIGNATWADICVIWARDVEDNQVKGFIVPTDTPGFTATKIVNKQSLRIVQNADIVLDNVRVSDDLKLANGNSFADLSRVLKGTRTQNGWFAAGVQAGAFELALDYAREREQFGKPIASYQMIQDLLVKSLGNLTASLSMMARLAELTNAGERVDEQAALAKAYTSSRARETVSWCRELFGGNGIDLGYGIARFFGDAEAVHTYEGTREMNTLIVGRDITGIGAFQ